SYLIMFTGRECTHCHEMDPLVDQLEKELGVNVDRLEVWHDEKNAKLLAGYDKGFCGGVPFFFNTKTGKWICGAVNIDVLKKWATG
ncbi:MAG: hypothetical protein AABX52_02915, partial [Nanoarchaeota archaeon]